LVRAVPLLARSCAIACLSESIALAVSASAPVSATPASSISARLNSSARSAPQLASSAAST
jgi:hypothetical protein